MIQAKSTIKPAMWCPGRNGHPLWRGCVGYWPLWESAGTRAMDLSGYGNHGILTSMDPPTDWINTDRGRGLAFDGDDDYVDVGNNPILNPSAAITVSGWVYRKGNGAGIGWLATRWSDAVGETDQRSWGLGFNILVPTFYVNGAVAFVASSVSITNNQWYHIAATYDRVNLKIYVNGVLGGTTAYSTALVSSTISTMLGRQKDDTYPRYFYGNIGQVTIHNCTLLAGQMAELAADQFCMIRPRMRTYFWVAASAADLWHSRAQIVG